jgi:Putative beta-barrel porin 2
VQFFCGLHLSEYSWVYAETKIIPSVTASERYDTNVFLAPRQFLPAGRQPSDFVSTLLGQLELLNKNRLADTALRASVDGNLFVNNTELNYISTNVGFSSKLDGLIGQYIPRAKLKVSDYFRYTPEPPNFITGVKPQAVDPFALGIQASRANTYTNAALAEGSYRLTRTVSLLGDYSYSIFRVGQLYAGTSTAYFDTNLHSWSLGPGFRLTRSDEVRLKYQDVHMNFSAPSVNSTFTARSLQAEYEKTTPTWAAGIRGGATVIDPGSRTFLSGGLNVTGKYGQSTSVRLTLSRGAAPAFFGTGTALITNNAGLSFEHQLATLLTVAGNAYYGYSETTRQPTTTFVTYVASADLRYRLTRTLSASLSYNYLNFDISQPGLGPYLVDRQLIMFSIISKWY